MSTAIIGGISIALSAMGLGGRLFGRAQAKKARDEARDRALELAQVELEKGIYQTELNAQQMAQDNMAMIAQSGVASDVGTASNIQQQVQHQKNAQIGEMKSDYELYEEKIMMSEDIDQMNYAASLVGDIFGTAGNIFKTSMYLNGPKTSSTKTTKSAPEASSTTENTLLTLSPEPSAYGYNPDYMSIRKTT